jgi:hypothetical protein
MLVFNALRRGRHPLHENIQNAELGLDVQGGECRSLEHWLRTLRLNGNWLETTWHRNNRHRMRADDESCFLRACPFECAILNFGQECKLQSINKLKLRFHRQNVLSCCLICSLGIDFEFLEGTNCQSKCAVTKRWKSCSLCKNKVDSRKYN